jgi:hypothetical protein
LNCPNSKELKLQNSAKFETFIQAHTWSIEVTYQKLQETKLVEVMHIIPFYLKFKIDSKIFNFKPNFINKSGRV